MNNTDDKPMHLDFWGDEPYEVKEPTWLRVCNVIGQLIGLGLVVGIAYLVWSAAK